MRKDVFFFRVLYAASTDDLHVSSSESPYSEHGALEEVENEGGTETHTSEDGEFRLFHVQKPFRR